MQKKMHKKTINTMQSVNFNMKFENFLTHVFLKILKFLNNFFESLFFSKKYLNIDKLRVFPNLLGRVIKSTLEESLIKS